MITSLDHWSEAPFLDGEPFGTTGAYLRISGVAVGRLDPGDPANRNIPWLEAAARTPSGDVEYRTPFELLRPALPGRGNGSVLYEATNRGKKLLFPYLFDAHSQSNMLDALDQLGNAAPLRRGFTLAWCGWDANAAPGAGALALEGPDAHESGKPIVRVVRDEFVSGTRHGILDRLRLSYDAASTDRAHTCVTGQAGYHSMRKTHLPGTSVSAGRQRRSACANSEQFCAFI